MDSLTQAALGAVVAHAAWQKPLGRSALVLGAALGTLPDLDVLLYPVLDEVQSLYWHRGVSHSVGFIALASGLLAACLSRLKRFESLSFARALVGVLLILTTHVMIDYFTVYGTQLLAPLSDYGFATGNVFIIDPLYTVPLLLAIGVAAWSSRQPLRAWRASVLALSLSSAYMGFSFYAQARADQVFRAQLVDLPVQSHMTMATAFNTVLWRHVAKVDNGFLIGYYSLWADAPDQTIEFDFIPQNAELLVPYAQQDNVAAIAWFSKGFWVATEASDGVKVADLRFGEIRGRWDSLPETWQYPFQWMVDEQARRLIKAEPPESGPEIAQAMHSLWLRLSVGATP